MPVATNGDWVTTMNDANSTVTSRNILVLGAGELGMPVLRNLARRAKNVDGAKISVLLRAATVGSDAPAKQRTIAELRNLGVEIVVGDLVNSSIDELASVFARYDTVIHLRTPRDGGGYNHRNPLRVESADEALALDARLLDAWQGHPHRVVIDAAADFRDKLDRTVRALRDELPTCCRAARALASA